jgi:hypothetical protein
MKELVGMDFENLLDRPSVKKEVADEIEDMMSEIMRSHAFSEAIKNIYETKKRDVT